MNTNFLSPDTFQYHIIVDSRLICDCNCKMKNEIFSMLYYSCAPLSSTRADLMYNTRIIVIYS